jgi:hypothetical protein
LCDQAGSSVPHWNLQGALVSLPRAGRNVARYQVGRTRRPTRNPEAHHAHRQGLTRVKGEHNGQAKLSSKQVIEIRKRIESGEKQSLLAAEFGVKEPIISQIKHRKRWAHI